MNDSGSILLDTSEHYCDSDIEVVYVDPGGSGANLQAGAGYSNGTYYPDTGYDGFSEFEVDVPNHYTQVDEGKVVSNGALVSQGSQTITDNGTYDTTLKNSVTVSVSTSATVDKKTKTLSASAGYITFDNLKGEPTTFVVISGANLATASAAKAAVCLYDGTNTQGLNVTNTSNQNCMYSSGGYSFSYSNGSLTVISSGADFQANEYKLVYSYGNTSSDIHVDGVQVGSGATSVSFTGLTAEPEYFTVMFTGSFGTSSGYTRTMAVVFDGASVYGMEMGSGAVASSNWTKSYSNGTLTITSTSSSAGGYFHQPGYYELCAVYGSGGGASLGTKSITANGTYNASSDGYDGYSQVTANVPNTYSAGDEGKVVSSGALVSQTAHADVTPTTSDQTINTTTNNSIKVKGDADLVAGNIKKDVDIFGVVGSYEGGGGSGEWTTNGIADMSQPSGSINITVNSISNTALKDRKQITNVTATSTTIGTSAFENCTGLLTASFPNATTVNTQAFYGCQNMTSLSIPKVTNLTNSVIYNCRALTSVDVSLVTTTENRAFQNSWALPIVDFPVVTNLAASCFESCRALATLILRNTSVVTLNNISAFTNTPMRGYNGGSGTVYVPSNLISSYQTASVWSNLYAEGHVTFAAIEGSQYE